jgi:catechol 2,3-dioxygenase-like lactoylglutathione lyase family enzyme
MKIVRHITLLVRDQDEALKFYTEKLGFIKNVDARVWFDSLRWVTISLKDQPDVEISLVLVDNEKKENSIGKQAGDNIFLSIRTDNFDQDYNELKSKGVNFITHPEEREWGIDAVFEDLYGNLIDLIQPLKRPPPEKL